MSYAPRDMSHTPRESTLLDWLAYAQPQMEHSKVPNRDRYMTVNRGGDRHGALEWSFSSAAGKDDRLTRMVGLAIIPDASGAEATIEFWFGARFKDRYIRRPASAIVFRYGYNTWDLVEQHLVEAEQMADSLTEDDLTQQIPTALW
ncbi:hypothetical protein [Streptomyces sp. NPDC059787]|uniref:hypothetical protein n=1 Tax=Streptomyces sp. NPDC059787 TaxID=3346947 RepID=UPI003656A958